jgi:chromosome partitioning protein
MIILSIASIKGGVGKTTTSINLAYGLAALGRKVLLCDLDPQSSLSRSLGMDQKADNFSDVLIGQLPMIDIIKPLAHNVDLVPGSPELANFELILIGPMMRENVIKRLLSTVDVYDIAICDCPPGWGFLVTACLIASHAVISPVVPDGLNLISLQLFLSNLKTIKKEILNPTLLFLGILVCQFDKRLILHKASLEKLQAVNAPILGVINKSVRAAVASGCGQPIVGGELEQQYKAFVLVVDEWLEKSIKASST